MFTRDDRGEHPVNKAGPLFARFDRDRYVPRMAMDATMLADTKTRLRQEFGAVPPETVDAVLRQATDDLVAHARVETFIPVIAERQTRARLAELARAQ
jgi:hypothetical protein